MLPIATSSSFTPYNYVTERFVDAANGNDSNPGTQQKPWKTLTKAAASIGNSGSTLFVAPGTYSASVTWNALNVDIVGQATRSGLVNITGAITFTQASSSVRCANLAFVGGFSLTGAGNLYTFNCYSGAALISQSNGYFESVNSDYSNSTGIAISAGLASLSGGKLTALTVSGTAIVGVYGCTNCYLPSVTGGALFIGESEIYALTSGGTAITTSAGSNIFLRDCLIYDSVGILTKVSFAGSWSMSNVQYNKAGSTLSGTNLGSNAWFDNIALYSNIIPGNATTVTAAGTTSLNINSPQWQTFTGSTTQTVRLPATTNVTTGTSWVINNLSSGTVTVQNASGTLIVTVTTGTYAVFTYTGVSTNNGWYVVQSTGGGVSSGANYAISVSAGGTSIANLISGAGITDKVGNVYAILNTSASGISFTTTAFSNPNSFPGSNLLATSILIAANAVVTIQTTVVGSTYLVMNISNSVAQNLSLTAGTTNQIVLQTSQYATTTVGAGSANTWLKTPTNGGVPIFSTLPPFSYALTTAATAQLNTLIANLSTVNDTVGFIYTITNTSSGAVLITNLTVDNASSFPSFVGASTIAIPANGIATIQTTVANSNYRVLNVGNSVAQTLSGGAAGQLPYQSAVNTTGFTAAGTTNQVLLSGGTGSPTWATAAPQATNLAGGIASQIPYQTAANTTAFIANGTAGQLLTSNGTSAPTWSTPLLSQYGSVLSPLSDGTSISTTLASPTTVLTFNLPSAGTWQLNYTVTASATGGTGGYVQSYLYDNNGSPVANKVLLTSFQDSGGTIVSGTNSVIVTTAGAVAYTVRCYSSNGGSLRNISTVGYTQGTYIQIAGLLASSGSLPNGAAGQVPYQSAANTTAFTAAGTTGQILQSNGTGAPTWVSSAIGPLLYTASPNSSQTIATATNVVIDFDTATIDTASCFNATTNRFTPNVAGYYKVTVMATYAGIAAGSFYSSFAAKNGSIFSTTSYLAPGATNGNYQSIVNVALFSMNGSTDYIEGYTRHNNGAGVTLAPLASSMQIEFVRGL